jgi:hypothetical protein
MALDPDRNSSSGLRPAVGHDEQDHGVGEISSDDTNATGVQKYSLSDDRKIGITGAVFLILNKMIGTGSRWPNLDSACRYTHILLWDSLLHAVRNLRRHRFCRY